MSEIGRDFEAWFGRLASRPLPGGVAAAAVGAAMGSALVVKVARLALRRHALSGEDRGRVESILGLAERQRAVLLNLAQDDEDGYQAVLDTGRLPNSSPERRQAWQRATETPLQVAEVCRELLDSIPALFGVCPLAARVDLAVGRRLLEVGLRAGLEAAESNFSHWGEALEALPFRSRIEELKRGWSGEGCRPGHDLGGG